MMAGAQPGRQGRSEWLRNVRQRDRFSQAALTDSSPGRLSVERLLNEGGRRSWASRVVTGMSGTVQAQGLTQGSGKALDGVDLWQEVLRDAPNRPPAAKRGPASSVRRTLEIAEVVNLPPT